MNSYDQSLISWVNSEINKGGKTIVLPASLLKNASPEGLSEARRLAELNGCELVVRA